MATLIDDATVPAVITRTILVTPEDPGSGSSIGLDPAPVTTTLALTAVLSDSSALFDPAPLTTTVSVTAALTDAAVLLDPAPLAMTIALSSDVAEAFPGLSLKVAVHGGFVLGAPPIAVSLGMGVQFADATLRPTSPGDGDTVEVGTPQFAVALNAHDQTQLYTVQVQYASDIAFSTATTVSGTATAIDGGIFLSPAAPLTTDTYWRARLLQADATVVVDWTSPVHFTVDTQLTPSDLTVTWAVDTVTRPIHLWHVVPDSAAVGDTATAYGQGFPASGSVLIDGIPCTVTHWQRNSAVINSTTAGRHIDADDIDPEHYEIDFIVPTVQPPGGVLEVTA